MSWDWLSDEGWFARSVRLNLLLLLLCVLNPILASLWLLVFQFFIFTDSRFNVDTLNPTESFHTLLHEICLRRVYDSTSHVSSLFLGQLVICQRYLEIEGSLTCTLWQIQAFHTIHLSAQSIATLLAVVIGVLYHHVRVAGDPWLVIAESAFIYLRW